MFRGNESKATTDKRRTASPLSRKATWKASKARKSLAFPPRAKLLGLDVVACRSIPNARACARGKLDLGLRNYPHPQAARVARSASPTSADNVSTDLQKSASCAATPDNRPLATPLRRASSETLAPLLEALRHNPRLLCAPPPSSPAPRGHHLVTTIKVAFMPGIKHGIQCWPAHTLSSANICSTAILADRTQQEWMPFSPLRRPSNDDLSTDHT